LVSRVRLELTENDF